MDHEAHEPGTVEACPACRALSYEPGWYRAMQRERASGVEPVVLPEADEIRLDVVLPDLEDVRREDEER
jgi:hypothetical protein